MRDIRTFERIFDRLGVVVSKEARILDFGCGAGDFVKLLREAGYVNAEGYDVTDGPSLLGHRRADYITTGTLLDLKLPFEDAQFDVVLSDQVCEHIKDQVRVFSELHRITKSGGHHLHLFPARYRPIEGHILVPFGGFIVHRWWYKLWALLGIRNQYQKGLSADETADRNAFFAVEALNYVPNSCYRVMWKKLGFSYRFVEREFFQSHGRQVMRFLGKIWGIPALYRTVQSRLVYLSRT